MGSCTCHRIPAERRDILCNWRCLKPRRWLGVLMFRVEKLTFERVSLTTISTILLQLFLFHACEPTYGDAELAGEPSISYTGAFLGLPTFFLGIAGGGLCTGTSPSASALPGTSPGVLPTLLPPYMYTSPSPHSGPNDGLPGPLPASSLFRKTAPRDLLGEGCCSCCCRISGDPASPSFRPAPKNPARQSGPALPRPLPSAGSRLASRSRSRRRRRTSDHADPPASASSTTTPTTIPPMPLPEMVPFVVGAAVAEADAAAGVDVLVGEDKVMDVDEGVEEVVEGEDEDEDEGDNDDEDDDETPGASCAGESLPSRPGGPRWQVGMLSVSLPPFWHDCAGGQQ
ncbi:hypothetical protein B0J12DRAFT_88107 [Macrophomina phaseolina]|uniref:Uncharacterized protein n=1 Tax=Macrophomina phaseolina TaxID=35725 RepID=A0ABQ8GAK5_9PEZI|nr:hypothetical protein B0J12DRAFT_88107 [Macrophomina phaseolina]